jgi:hypothetical protein
MPHKTKFELEAFKKPLHVAFDMHNQKEKEIKSLV